MSRFLLLALLPALAVAAPKKSKSAPKSASKKSAPVQNIVRGESGASDRGADSTDGYIIRRTDKGVVKIPKQQTFRFEGSNVEGTVARPSQSLLGSRQGRSDTSLIPVRTNFRRELMESSGYPAQGGRN